MYLPLDIALMQAEAKSRRRDVLVSESLQTVRLCALLPAVFFHQLTLNSLPTVLTSCIFFNKHNSFVSN